ncbi:MAG: glycosyltransferase family 39 protein [Bacteroidota bacterium]
MGKCQARKLVLIFLPALFILSVLPIGASANLIANGGFENVAAGQPEMWSRDVWVQGDDATRFSVETGRAHTGARCAVIESYKENDAKLVQHVRVKPGTVYKLSCWIKAENAGPETKGANITVLGILETSKDLRDTQGKWEYVELYGRTGPKQEEVSVSLRLGGYGSLNTGRAFFDDVVMEEADAPAGATVVNLFAAEPAKPVIPPIQLDFSALAGTPILLLITVMAAAGFLLVYRSSLRGGADETGADAQTWALTNFFAAALILRMVLAVGFKGHPIDMGCFKGWADHAARGLSNFYNSGMFVDYPPGYIYVLYLIGKLRALFHLGYDADAYLLLVKLPAILADLAASYIIFRLAEKRLGPRVALALSMLYAFNPAVIADSAAWGQVDAVFTVCALLALLLIDREKFGPAGAIYAAAVLIKPQAILLAPVFLFALVSKRSWKALGESVLWGVAVLVLAVLPFSVRQGFAWVFKLYKGTVTQYPYASLNAFNFFALFGGNWQSETSKFFLFSYKTWSTLFITASVVFAGYLYFKAKDRSRLYWASMFIMFAIFVLAAGMHERYMFPAFVLALAAYIYARDRRLLYLYAGISLAGFLNIGHVFVASLKHSYQIPRYDVLLLLTALANVLLLAYMVKVGIDIYVKGKTKPIPARAVPDHRRKRAAGAAVAERPRDAVLPQEREEPEKPVYTRQERLLVGGLTLVYAVIALINLGSFKAPETFWRPANAGEGLYLDLGETRALSKITYFPGLGNGAYRIEFSDDAQSWRPGGKIQPPSVFTWGQLGLGTQARFVKLTAEQPGAMLNEVGIFGPDGRKPLAIEAVTAVNGTQLTEGDVRNVADEQDKVAYEPSFMNSMYFDEIYHARTAYEHLHRIEPFESTHPPLGKILIALGVAVFGMNPFGWRIVGTLFGIALIPLMYVFAKRIFKKTEYAFLAAFLMAFDFMHFTQSRIATIDIYSVFFTILMYYFIYQYYRLNFHQHGLKRTLVPLGLAGLFFGIGAACKWTSAYSGLGLGIIILIVLWQRYLEYARARKTLARTRKQTVKPAALAQAKLVRSLFPRYASLTIVWCLVFFIVVPVIIYALSYIPFMLVPGPGHGLPQVVTYQQHMFKYHSELRATHPFSSTWWEWPLIKRPIWYYQGSGAYPAGKISSIVLLGNPAVWWLGIVAVFFGIAAALKKRDKTLLVIFVGLASQYLPWVLVPRLTFIYHFFTSLPFVMLLIAYLFIQLREEYPRARHAMYGYMALVLLLFVMFYPILSGALVDRNYVANFLRWFNNWVFFS